MSELPPIAGTVDPSFARMRRAFEENFLLRGEVGAAVSVYAAGRKVVDLWGGHRDGARRLPWEPDTLVCMMSVTKGLCAIAVLMLVERGKISLDERVAKYWPGFGRAGKQDITVRQLMGGFAALIYLEHAAPGALIDWDAMVEAIERQPPLWPVGTRGAYHSSTGGFLFAELVHQVDGRTIDVFLREEIAAPLGVEYVLGLRPAQIPRVAEVIPNPGSVTGNALQDPTSKLGRAWASQPDWGGPMFNDPRFRSAVIPSASGHSNARSVARIFAALAQGGELDGVRRLSPAVIELARQVQWDDICAMTVRPFRYGLGMFLSKGPMANFGPNPGAFGHPGAGGALGFADPENRLSCSYSPNFMCAGAGLGERCEALIAALYS
jgi:CubicO group peptidase (beta-lactamase class C family)